MNRQDQFDNVFMNIASEIANLSRANKRKVGCIIVKDKNILSFGFNGTPTGFDNECEIDFVNRVMDGVDEHHLMTKPEVLHAESNALMKLTKCPYNAVGGTLYVTYAPCFDCAKLIIQAEIKRVVYRDIKDDYEGIKLLQRANIIVDQLSNGLG